MNTTGLAARPPKDDARLNDSVQAADNQKPSVTLRAFLAQVEGVLRAGLPERLWIHASVLAVKPTRSGTQIQLAEDEARLDAFLPAQTIAAMAAAAGPIDPTLLVGMTILVEIAPAFSPRWHLQARILDLAPEVTRSLAALRIERLRASLKAERLYDRQRRLVSPPDVTRVAVIHPLVAASQADVAAELARWEAVGLLAVAFHAATFEGPRAADQLKAALAHAADTTIQGHKPDLILVIRGGGSRASLAVLDDETLVRAICLCPVPVLTGLGHAIDKSLVDEVAWRSSDTPSKAIAELRELMLEPGRRTLAAIDEIARSVSMRLAEQCTELDRAYGRLLTAARHSIDPVERMVVEHWTGTREAIAGFAARLGRESDETSRLLGRVIDGVPLVIDRAARELLDRMAEVAATVRRSLAGVDPGGALVANIVARTPAIVDAQKVTIDHALETAAHAAPQHLAFLATELTAIEQSVNRHDIASVLAQGYALPLDRDGRLLRSRDAAHAARELDLLLHDGCVAAVVVDPLSATARTKTQ